MVKYHYETVFILSPVLSEAEAKDTVNKFKGVLSNLGAEIFQEENWGLRQLAYPIQRKTTGSYHLLEYKGNRDAIKLLETEFRRDESVMRFLTISLDKYGIEYNDKRRKGVFVKKQPQAAQQPETVAAPKVKTTNTEEAA